MARVLVTRPAADARRTAARLAALGHEAVLAPVLAIAPTAEPAPAGPFDAVILTSANALPFVPPERKLLPTFVVGERTAAAARAAGFARVRVGAGEARSLARLVADHLRPPARLLHAAGRDRKAEPGLSLAARGFEVAAWEAYEARALSSLRDEAQEALAAGTIAAVLHYSRRSAALLLALAGADGLVGALRPPLHLCLSADAAAPLREAGLGRILVAPRLDEAALLALLDPA